MPPTQRHYTRRAAMLTVPIVTIVGFAGCLSGDEETDNAGGDSADSGDESTTPSESELESIFRAYVEYESKAELEDLLHPDSSIVPMDPYDEWEFAQIRSMEEESADRIVATIEKQRVSDGIYTSVEVELRPHDGEWLIYNTD